MFKKPTVIVVGAGASAELSLPTGAELKQKIAEGLRFRFEYGRLMSGDSYILDALKTHVPNDQNKVGEFTQAGNQLAETISTFPSIDEALHWWRAKPEIVELGKVAIAHYILESERDSSLAIKRGAANINIDDSSGSWLQPFFSIALAAGDREGVASAFDNVTFINFNYDRTIEQYIYWALQQRAGVDAKEAAMTVSRLKVIRPYGSIGNLDWLRAHEVAFGDRAVRDIFAVSSNIRTFTEQAEEVSAAAAIDEALEAAKVVIFLGFGFHQQNLALFRPGPGRRRAGVGTVLATTLGIDSKNYSAIASRLSSALALNSAMLVPLTASQLLNDLRPTITMASS
jgi:hypothetical protein